MSPTLKRIQVARTTLLLDNPFFGVLSLGLTVVEDTTCETAWTNGKQIGFSPAFVATLNDDQLMAVVAHEVMHCACGHPWRRNGRDAERWNKACDYAINSILANARFALPTTALLDNQYKGRWAEWIYDRLPADKPNDDGSSSGDQPSPQSSDDPGGLGEVRDAPDDADSPTEADWQQQAAQAERLAPRGTMSGDTREQIDQAMRPRVEWRSLLRRYVQEIARSDYSWSRPNVRYIPSGLYLPSLHSHVCGPLAIAIDTSGSIDTVLLGQFAAEIRTIADEMQPSRVDVLYCDARVHRVDRYERGDMIEISAVGRGGTSFIPVFERIDQDGEPPACLIYLTDLDGSFPDVAPEYPVIWASYGRSTSVAPFGDTVPCE